MRSKFRIFNEEWDSAAGQIVLPQHPSPQADRLSLIRSNVELELRVLEDIVADLDLDGDAWDADEAVERFMMSRRIDGSVFHFMENQIQRKLKLGRLRSAEDVSDHPEQLHGLSQGRRPYIQHDRLGYDATLRGCHALEGPVAQHHIFLYANNAH